MKSIESKKPTAGVILAAGKSTRLGRPKQLLEIKGKILIEWVLEAALNSDLGMIILVLGYEYQKISQVLGSKLQHPRLEVLINHQYQDGLSRSLQCGLQRIKNTFPSVIFLLGDQPMINSKTINHLLDSFWSSNKEICVPVHQGQRGNPVIFGKSLYPQLEKIEGDQGARDLIRTQEDKVLFVEMAEPLLFLDIDTEEDFKKLNFVF